VSLTGNFSGMGQLARNLERLAHVPSQASASAAERISGLLQDEFDAGNDPYGRAWAPLRPSTLRAGRTPPPLTNTRAMRDGLTVAPLSGGGIGVSFASPTPAVFHQKGTSRMVARKILPEGTMPKTWNAAIVAASSEAVARAMGGK
jgi:hypothetical protein